MRSSKRCFFMVGDHRQAIRIRTSTSAAFDACRDVSRWPLFMPAVRFATFLEQEEHGDVVTITAEANEKMWSWNSRRSINKEAGLIRFERLDPEHPLIRMGGQWTIRQTEGAVEVELTHSFETADDHPESHEFLLRAIRSNAIRDLEALRAHLECAS